MSKKFNILSIVAISILPASYGQETYNQMPCHYTVIDASSDILGNNSDLGIYDYLPIDSKNWRGELGGDHNIEYEYELYLTRTRSRKRYHDHKKI